MADKIIERHIGSYLNGKIFSAAAFDLSIPGGNASGTVLFKNPIASGKNAYLQIFQTSFSEGGIFVVNNIYSEPTVSANGTTAVIRSHLIKDSAPSSIMEVYAMPTITADGNRFISASLPDEAGTGKIDLLHKLVIFPGKSILIKTRHTKIAALDISFYLNWIEV